MPSKQVVPPAPPSASDESGPSRARATALPPSERRAEIIAATLPLLLAHGASVTTRQIAEAAGVAEGTIFRVFPDKDSLIQAVFEAALDMSTVDSALAAIDPRLALEPRLIAAVEILRRRVADLLRLRTAVEMMPGAAVPMKRRPHAPDLSAIAALFEPDRDQIRRSPREAAHLLHGLTIAGTHPAMISGKPLTAAEIVSLLLDGVRIADDHTPARGDRAC